MFLTFGFLKFAGFLPIMTLEGKYQSSTEQLSCISCSAGNEFIFRFIVVDFITRSPNRTQANTTRQLALLVASLVSPAVQALSTILQHSRTVLAVQQVAPCIEIHIW